MPRRILGLVLIAAACGGTKPDPATPAPAPELQPLAAVVAQNIIVAPAQSLYLGPGVNWSPPPLGRPTLARLDSAIADSLRLRVGNQLWVYADGVDRSFRNNPTYATDPRALAVNSLRSPRLKPGDRLLEPLASQVRTMIALHDARLVLVPVELRFDRVSNGVGRPVVRLVLIDPRSSTVRWIGEVQAPELSAFNPVFNAIIASRVADLFVAK